MWFDPTKQIRCQIKSSYLSYNLYRSTGVTFKKKQTSNCFKVQQVLGEAQLELGGNSLWSAPL